MEAATAEAVVLVLSLIASITNPKPAVVVALAVMPVTVVKELELKVPHLVVELLELLVVAAVAAEADLAILVYQEAVAESVCMDKAQVVVAVTFLTKVKEVLEGCQLL
jgi:hypothetical protein